MIVCRCSGSGCAESVVVKLSVNHKMKRGVLTLRNGSTQSYETVFLTPGQLTSLARAMGHAAQLIDNAEWRKTHASQM